MNYDWEEITGKLTKLLRVHNTPIGMKGFHTSIPKSSFSFRSTPINWAAKASLISQ